MLAVADNASNTHYRERESLIHWKDEYHCDISMVNLIPKMSATPGAVPFSGPELEADKEHI